MKNQQNNIIELSNNKILVITNKKYTLMEVIDQAVKSTTINFPVCKTDSPDNKSTLWIYLEPDSVLSNNLRYLRTINEWKMLDLYVKTGISPSCISVYEKNRVTRISKKNVLKLAEVFKVKFEDLLYKEFYKDKKELKEFISKCNKPGKINLTERIGSNVLNLRISNNWSQYDLYKRSGVRMSDISRIERCFYDTVYKRKLEEIARALNVTLTDLKTATFGTDGRKVMPW